MKQHFLLTVPKTNVNNPYSSYFQPFQEHMSLQKIQANKADSAVVEVSGKLFKSCKHQTIN